MYNVYPTVWFVLCIPSPALRPSPCLCCFFCFCVFCVSHYNLVHLIFRIILKWVTCLIILTWPMAWNRFEEAANTKECSFKEEASSRWMTTSRSVSESFSVLFCSDNWRHLWFSDRASDSMCGWRVHRRQYWKSRIFNIEMLINAKTSKLSVMKTHWGWAVFWPCHYCCCCWQWTPGWGSAWDCSSLLVSMFTARHKTLLTGGGQPGVTGQHLLLSLALLTCVLNHTSGFSFS